MAGVILLFAITFVSCTKNDTASPQSLQSPKRIAAQASHSQDKDCKCTVIVYDGTWIPDQNDIILCWETSSVCYIVIQSNADAGYNPGIYINNAGTPYTHPIYIDSATVVSSTTKSDTTAYTISKAISSGFAYPVAFSTIQRDLGY